MPQAGNLLTANQESVETSVDHWTDFHPGSSALVQSTTQALEGTHALAATSNGTADILAGMTATGGAVTTVAARAYTFNFYVYSPRATGFLAVVDWYQSGNATYISTTTGPTTTVPVNTWTKVGGTGEHTAPALGVVARVYLECAAGLTTGDIVYLDWIYFGIPVTKDVTPPQSRTRLRRASTW